MQFYNKTKCGVDILDQMARRYSTRAAASRWPVHVFYNVLDLAAINAWTIYRGVTGEEMSLHALLRNYGRLALSGSEAPLALLVLKPKCVDIHEVVCD